MPELPISPKKVLQTLKKAPFDNFKTFNERFSIIHEFVIRIGIIGGLCTFFYFSLKEITSNKYVLTSIEVARATEDKDKIYSSDLKQEIILSMKKIIGNAKNATHSTSNVANSVSNDAIPLNIGGFDLSQMFLYVRKFLTMQNREIRAYILNEGSKYKVLLSVGNEAQIENTFLDKKAVSLFLAERILKYNSPHKLGLYLIEQQDTTKNKEIEDVIKDLKILEEKETWREKLFQNNNWKAKRLHLEAMKYYSKKDYLSAKNKYDSIPNYEHYPEILLETAQLNNQIRKTPTYKESHQKTYYDINSRCNQVLGTDAGRYLEDDEDGNTTKINSLKNTARIILADMYV